LAFHFHPWRFPLGWRRLPSETDNCHDTLHLPSFGRFHRQPSHARHGGPSVRGFVRPLLRGSQLTVDVRIEELPSQVYPDFPHPILRLLRV
jgi:hypothetical protein